MHRSGTSVVTGVLDRLGLDGGPRDLMLDGDRFNADGYWEQRPLVELHRAILRRERGFASAPPKEPMWYSARSRELAARGIDQVLSVFADRPWFLKDPAHCLLLDLWDDHRGLGDLAVVVSRAPRHVARSLRHRNRYSEAMALGLWERYSRATLGNLAGRACHFVRYEDLLEDPHGTVADLAATLNEVFGMDLGPEIVTHAAELVRPSDRASSSSATAVANAPLAREQSELDEILTGLRGYHRRFGGVVLPAPSSVGVRALERRRRLLLLATSVVTLDLDRSARLDRRGR
ncbi:hypothetical protein [Georgenia alba]|uniref:Sulfotransferase family protein n=1 Tax=Georgenia alba TaxID=2233858 RepID=A0ABW2Q4P5_9MICO